MDSIVVKIGSSRPLFFQWKVWPDSKVIHIYTSIYLEKSGSGPVVPVQNCLSSVLKVVILNLFENKKF